MSAGEPDREKDLEGVVDDLLVMLRQSKDEYDKLLKVVHALGARMRAWKTSLPTIKEYEKLPVILDLWQEEGKRKERKLVEQLRSCESALDRSMLKHRQYILKKRKERRKKLKSFNRRG